MTRRLPFIIIAVVALLTLGAGTFLYQKYRQQVITLTKEQQEAARQKTTHALGPAKALVTLEEFGDFQCPPCGRLSGPLHQIVRLYPKRVRLIFRQFPLATHSHAKAAAYAAEAAGLQGKFWEMHDLLYREQETWSKATEVESIFDSYARLLGLDLSQFQKDIKGETVRARVAADQKRAAELGVTITPSIFLNGKLVTGRSLSPIGVRNAVEAELASIPAP